MLTFILPVFLIIALVAVLPIWRHSKKWSFYPLGGVSLVILILLILFLDRPFLGEKFKTLRTLSPQTHNLAASLAGFLQSFLS